jgi:hypothetical protein
VNDVRALIVYSYAGEENITQQFLHIMIVVASISIFLRFQNYFSKKLTAVIHKEDIIVVPILIALILLYRIPNGSGAGMMSDRYCLLFFMVSLVWVCTQPIPKGAGQFAMALILVFHLNLLFTHEGTIRNLNKDAKMFENAAKYISSGSIVLPVDMTNNWLETHFGDYLGIDKPLVILENYEANEGYFPVQWNSGKIPKITINVKATVDGFHRFKNINTKKIKQIDYIILYGSDIKIDDPESKKIKDLLSENYKLIYSSDNRYINLYYRIDSPAQ